MAYKYGFFFEGHREIIDCLAGIHILAQDLVNSKESVFKRVLDNAMQLEFKLITKNTPYASKDLLKTRGYRWGMPPINRYRTWYITAPENRVEEEIKYLRFNIYDSNTTFPIEIEISDASNKHAVSHQPLYRIYQQKIC